MIVCNLTAASEGNGFSFEVLFEVVIIINARYTSHSYSLVAFLEVDRSCLSDIIYSRSHPSAEIQVPHIVACFMIATHKNCEVRCWRLSSVVLVESSHFLVLGWAVQVLEIFGITDSLEVATDDQTVDFDACGLLESLQLGVDLI
jgi:hypothetical protein